MKTVAHWRFILALIVLLIIWLAGSIPAAGFLLGIYRLLNIHLPITSSGILADSYTLPLFLLQISGFFMLALGIYLAVRYILRVSLLEFVTDAPVFRFHRAAAAAGLWIGLMIIIALFEWAIGTAGAGEPTVRIRQWLLFLPFALLLIPLQAGSEELLFRTFPGRWITNRHSGSGNSGSALSTATGSARSNSRQLLAAGLSGLVFLTAHLLNPEIAQYGDSWALYLYYFFFGAALMWVSLRDGGYELAVGIHVGNNLFTSLFLNYEGSVMATPSLFTARDVAPGPALAATVLSMIVIGLLFLYGPMKRIGTAMPAGKQS